MSVGRLFQISAPATGNDREPNVTQRTRGTSNCAVSCVVSHTKETKSYTGMKLPFMLHISAGQVLFFVVSLL